MVFSGLTAAAWGLLPAAGLARVSAADSADVEGQRPARADRRFISVAVERYLTETSRVIADAELRRLFVNCFPNTLDTTVQPG